ERRRLRKRDEHVIVRVYGAECRGVVNYYLPAQDVWRLRTLRWHAETSMLKTLAAKHKSTVTKMAARHQAKVITGDGPRTCYEARRKRKGKAGPGSTIRRDHPAAGPAGGHHRPCPGPGPRSPHGAARAAPPTGMRALR